MNDMGTVSNVIVFIAAGLVVAGWYNLTTIEWALLRLRARRMALIAYRSEYNRIIEAGEIG